jgi:hypothetical protein
MFRIARRIFSPSSRFIMSLRVSSDSVSMPSASIVQRTIERPDRRQRLEMRLQPPHERRPDGQPESGPRRRPGRVRRHVERR